jgi:D-alanine--(R)-lactate ligase
MPNTAPSKTKVAILFGGCSEEHDVSTKSAAEIASHIDADKYEPLYIGITRSGAWRLCERPHAQWENDNCPAVVFSPSRETHGLLIFKDHTYETRRIDVAFPILHGTSGEDGSIQGLFELANIPYVGCDIQSSAICMDKSLTYAVAQSAGIATPPFWVLDGDETPAAPAAAAAASAFTYPLFVKPARSGSSFGVSKVESKDALHAAIAHARRYDRKVLIEQAVFGCEVGCAVLGNGSDLIVGEVDQITLTHGIFRIHQEAEPEKGSENALIAVPAPLSPKERKRIREEAQRIYQALGCRGLARIDMFLREDGRIVLNEVNTLPGFTSYSRYPRMMAATGITMPELIDHLITLALRRR